MLHILSWVLNLIQLDEQVMDRLGQMIDLLLQLLDVLVDGVAVVGIGGVRLAKLTVIPLLGVLDLLVALLDDLLHLLSLADLAEDVALELKHGLPDDLVIEVDHVGGDLLLELRVLVHDWLKLLLPKTIGINMVECLIAELSTSAKEVLIATNNGLVSQLNVEVSLLVVSEANAVLSVLLLGKVGALRDHIDLLVDLVFLLKDELFWLEEPWLQGLKHLDHELRVLGVGPLVEVGVPVVGGSD